jgi:hypothetical protein
MFRRFGSLVLVLLAAQPALAQSPETTIQLTIHPAAPPTPALRYQLLPQMDDWSPGNRALLYYRSFSPEWEEWRRRPGFLDQMDRALHAPLRELPRKHLDWVLQDKQLHEVDLAARREYVNWDLTTRVRSEGMTMLLPDMESFRILANMLALRARLQIADQHYDRAVYTLQTGYSLGRDLGDAPLLVSALVGVSIGTVMSEQVEQLVQAPGSPNLYWALTALPSPLINLRKPLQSERMIVYAEVPELRDIETTQLSPAQQQAFVDHVIRFMALLHDERVPSGPNWEGKWALTALAAKYYPEAKRALLAQGRKVEDVEGLPVLQVVMIHVLHQYQRLQDDLFKWFNLPYWQAEPELAKADQQIAAARSRLEAQPLLDLLPAIRKVYATTARLDRHIAALRCVEAIRMYAAAHDGKLPATLNDITDVPVPSDPMTGESFKYRAAGNKASLSAPIPPGMPSFPQDALAYELILKR